MWLCSVAAVCRRPLGAASFVKLRPRSIPLAFDGCVSFTCFSREALPLAASPQAWNPQECAPAPPRPGGKSRGLLPALPARARLCRRLPLPPSAQASCPRGRQLAGDEPSAAPPDPSDPSARPALPPVAGHRPCSLCPQHPASASHRGRAPRCVHRGLFLEPCQRTARVRPARQTQASRPLHPRRPASSDRHASQHSARLPSLACSPLPPAACWPSTSSGRLTSLPQGSLCCLSLEAGMGHSVATLAWGTLEGSVLLWPAGSGHMSYPRLLPGQLAQTSHPPGVQHRAAAWKADPCAVAGDRPGTSRLPVG